MWHYLSGFCFSDPSSPLLPHVRCVRPPGSWVSCWDVQRFFLAPLLLSEILMLVHASSLCWRDAGLEAVKEVLLCAL